MQVFRFRDLVFLTLNIGALVFFSASFFNTTAGARPSGVLSASTSQNVPSPQYADGQLKEVADKINAVRVLHGLSPLTQSPILDQVSEERAQEMSTKAYYAHKDPDGHFFDSLLTDHGVDYQYACENLNMAEVANAKNFVESWLTSESHKECLLDNRITSAGYAITKIHISNGVPIDQYVVVAIYMQNTL